MPAIREAINDGATCKPKPHVRDRSLMSVKTAAELEAMFKVLGNQTRLRILHTIIRENEICVTDLAETIEMKPQAVSNQLQRMVARGILGTRRNGNNIYYSIADPCVVGLMNQGFCLMQEAKERSL